MRVHRGRTKDTNTRQVVIKDLGELGRTETPSQGNVHPRNRKKMRMLQSQFLQRPCQGVATQESTQQTLSINLRRSRSLRITILKGLSMDALEVRNTNRFPRKLNTRGPWGVGLQRGALRECGFEHSSSFGRHEPHLPVHFTCAN